MTSVIVSNASLRDLNIRTLVRTDEQLIERFVMGCVNISTDNHMEDITNQLEMMQLWYILILNNRACDIYSRIIQLYGKNNSLMFLYYPWAYSIHYKIRDLSKFRIYLDRQLCDHSILLSNEDVMYEVYYAVACGLMTVEVRIAGWEQCLEYFDSHYLFYYFIHTKNPFLAIWFYIAWLTIPNFYYAKALIQYQCFDKRSIIESKLKIDKHLKAKASRHWELVRKSRSIDYHDHIFRMSYNVIDGTFRFGATLNFIKDRYHSSMINMFSGLFSKRLKNIHGDDHIAFVQDYNYNCTNVIAHILHFVVCEVEIITTFAELMNQKGAIFAEIQDRKTIDFHEPIVIQFGCIGPYIHGPCCIVGKTFQYCWMMKDGLLDGTAEYKNLTTKLKYTGEFKNDNLMYSYTEVIDNSTKKKISAAYKEGTLHGICRADEYIAAYNYGDRIIY